jgi:hypothetical protein
MVHYYAGDAYPAGLSGSMFAVAVAGVLAYTLLIAAGGFALGRLDREQRRDDRDQERLAAAHEKGGAHRRETWGLAPDDAQRIPDLGDVLSHRAKGRRP